VRKLSGNDSETQNKSTPIIYNKFFLVLRIYVHGVQVLSKIGPSDVAGEIGVVFNIPQPFTMRTKRLSQVIRLSHHHLKQMVQPHSEDGKTIISNFTQVKELICLIA
jgi:CRP-like cAMP-binding protein